MEYRMLGCYCSQFSFCSYARDINRCCQKHDSCYEEAKNLGGCEFPKATPTPPPTHTPALGGSSPAVIKTTPVRPPSATVIARPPSACPGNCPTRHSKALVTIVSVRLVDSFTAYTSTA